MDWHIALDLVNSGLLALILAGLIQWHKDWAQTKLKVDTLWERSEDNLKAEAEAKALENLRAFAARGGVPHE